MQQAGAAGGGGAEDLGEAAARAAVDLRDAGRTPFRLRAGLPVEVAAEHRFELFFEDCGRAYIRYLFA